jgi:hypothetical protein
MKNCPKNMNMFNDEKKILNSNSIEAPDKNVLDEARAHMGEQTRKTFNKRILKNVLVSFASFAVTVLILVMCIPAMLPANSGDPNYITLDEMTTKQMASIAEYNQENGTNIHHFDNGKDATAYYFEDKIMCIEEKAKAGNLDVKILVLFAENTLSYGFEILDNQAPILPDSTHHNIEGVGVQVSKSNQKTYLHFSVNNYEYYLEIDGTNADWQTIFNDFVN